MNVKVLHEQGYYYAMLGLSLSYDQDPAKMGDVAKKLAHKGDGHNKFLESIQLWLDMNAPRNFWQQFDTYRVGVTKQSSSTMHTMTARQLTQDDFSHKMPLAHLETLNLWIRQGKWETVKWNLPESFMQRRIVCLNYMALQRIVRQRKNHKLEEWQEFIGQIMDQVEFPGFLLEDYEKDDTLEFLVPA